MKDLNNVFFLQDNLLISNKFNNEVDVIFTTRLGGVSQKEFSTNNLAFQVGDNYDDVLQNRKLLAEKLNIPLSSFVFANQNHGINIQKITKDDCGKGMENFEDGILQTDCLYTYEKDIPLACFYADCTPIYFYESNKKLVGVIHAGWQGTAKNIVKVVMEYLQKQENIDFTKLQIIIGPNIKKESFEVQEDVYQQFKNNIYTTKDVIQENERSWNIDIVKYNKNSLIEYGVKEENIFISSLDTVKEQNLFSFRRDQQTGRMLAIIKL